MLLKQILLSRNAFRPKAYPGSTRCAGPEGIFNHSDVPGCIGKGTESLDGGGYGPGPKPNIGQYHAKAGEADRATAMIMIIATIQILVIFITRLLQAFFTKFTFSIPVTQAPDPDIGTRPAGHRQAYQPRIHRDARGEGILV